MTKLHTLTSNLLLVALFVIAVSIVGYTYLVVFHDNPATVIRNSPFPVDRSEYKNGDVIIATIDICRYSLFNNPQTVERYVAFVDGLQFNVPPVTIYTPAGVRCGVSQVNLVTIPESLPEGVYYLAGRSETRVNPFAVRSVEWKTMQFRVVQK